MGIYCKKPLSSSQNSQKIYQLQTINEPDSDNQFHLITYDINQEKIYISKINFRIITSIKGLSQLNHENTIFLCGGLNKNELSGSILIRIETNNLNESKIHYLINSQFIHQYPSMLYIGNCLIIIIGGKKQIKCECFDYEYNKWSNLPDLPEERYHCSLCLDNSKNFIYLFGGFNKEINCNVEYILRLSIDDQLKWEKIIIKDSFSRNLIMKNSCSTFSVNNDIFILGGKNNFGKLCNDIIKFDVKNNIVCKMSNTLEKKSKFYNQSGVCVNDIFYIFFDSNDFIHKVYKDDAIFIPNDSTEVE